MKHPFDNFSKNTSENMPQRTFTISVKGIIRNSHGKILLIKRSANSKGNPGKWDLPGGKMDQGETPDQALKREVMEETGLSIEVQNLAGAVENRLDNRSIIYIVLNAYSEKDEVRLSEEHEDFTWVDTGSVPEMDVVPAFNGFLRKNL